MYTDLCLLFRRPIEPMFIYVDVTMNATKMTFKYEQNFRSFLEVFLRASSSSSVFVFIFMKSLGRRTKDDVNLENAFGLHGDILHKRN